MSTSGLVLTGACIVVAIWDLCAVHYWGVNYSVSRYIQQSAVTHPSLLFALGWLCGHFFASMSPVVVNQ